VKINELKYQPLEEGFIDDLIDKVKNMAGGDGLTGLIRSLSGQGAALNKLADQIARELESPLLRELGNNIRAIKNGTQPVPMGRIIQLGLRSGATVAQHDGDIVSPAEILNFLKANKENVVRVAGGGMTPQVIDAIIRLSDTKTADPVPNLNFDKSIHEVALVIAAAIILVQAAKAEAGPEAATERDTAQLEKFKQLGEKVQEALFDPTSALLKALQPNEDFKDNLHWLVITMTQKVQNEIAKLPAPRLEAMLTNPPPLLTPMQFKTALSGHTETADPTVVAKVIETVTPVMQEQFKTWLQLAIDEAKAGNGIEESVKDFGDWARESMAMIDLLHFNKTTPKKPDREKVESTIEDLFDKAHEAGDNARRAVKQTPGESDADFVERANAEYDKAREAYLKTNTTP
jgi:hypothetical protein